MNFTPKNSKRKIILSGKKKDIKGRNALLLPFRSSENYVHPDIPSEWAHFPHISMKPLIQIPIVDILIHKHPNCKFRYYKISKKKFLKRSHFEARTLTNN